ncbi:hypothetical protein SAMN04488047_1522 [Tranquillimonas alkanivorans]|uniref:Uncharacterized protein n=2 Tax=Tranquillimonas alkanivorans TaxID=441119 RepID=A0A1I5WQ43_9RHOB|nr:hypothetical protein SAMN04488047_1522 [Tranquillimonas alkanivorans]
MRNMSPDELRELIAEIELLIHRKYAEARAAVKVIARDAGLPLRALAS